MTASEIETMELPKILPLLPLKEGAVFPYVIAPLSIGREISVESIEKALAKDRLIFIVSQKHPHIDLPGLEDLYEFGTIGSILRMLRLPDGRIRVLVQGLKRGRVKRLLGDSGHLRARVIPVDEGLPPEGERVESKALFRSVQQQLETILQLGREISPEVLVISANLDDAGRLADLAASNLNLETSATQKVLSELDPLKRLSKVHEYLTREVQILKMQEDLNLRAQNEMEKGHLEFFLRQQMEAIRDQLGEGDSVGRDISEYREAASKAGFTEEAQEEFDRQIRRLEMSPGESAEASTIRTYLDWLTSLPWSHESTDNLELNNVRRTLDEDHQGLEEAKKRILEFLAVRRLRADSRGPILCFVGPPGVGKTSLGRSIASALGREYVRLALGGIHDEAEIRGHRRTYVGALPGRILQGLRRAGTQNPVFVLDEIDKISRDFRGDPSSALLEVLDPEQNHTFRDHYLGVAYDLSKVLFISTANHLDSIHPALLDRLEVVELSGYTAEEKLQIARKHLLPRLLESHGLKANKIRFKKQALNIVIREYTREAGVRNLEKRIAAILRQVALKVAEGEQGIKVVTPGKLPELLGPAPIHSEEILAKNRVGVATGLAWTSTGGDLMIIEVALLPGKGRLILTGQLGDVMKESAQAAYTYAQAFLIDNGIKASRFARTDLHLHAPAGAIPKDGPSAGITIATAIVSAYQKIPVSRRLAMTGEITLRGEVLPIGGLKEKLLAARASGIHRVLLPELNRRDLLKVPPEVKKDLELVFVQEMNQVLRESLASSKN